MAKENLVPALFGSFLGSIFRFFGAVTIGLICLVVGLKLLQGIALIAVGLALIAGYPWFRSELVKTNPGVTLIAVLIAAFAFLM